MNTAFISLGCIWWWCILYLLYRWQYWICEFIAEFDSRRKNEQNLRETSNAKLEWQRCCLVRILFIFFASWHKYQSDLCYAHFRRRRGIFCVQRFGSRCQHSRAHVNCHHTFDSDFKPIGYSQLVRQFHHLHYLRGKVSENIFANVLPHSTKEPNDPSKHYC